MPKRRIPTPASLPKKLPVTAPTDDACVRFSFKYSQFDSSPKYCIAERDARYFRTLLARLQEVSRTTTEEFRRGGNYSLRNHPINFASDKVSETGFSCLPLNLRNQVEGSAFQFALSANEHGRVHGFLIDAVFFVVWFDPNHELYPGSG